MTRQPKTPQQRAQEQLDTAERLVARLEKKRDQLEGDLKVIRTGLDAQQRRRDYLAQHPDLDTTQPHTTQEDQ